MKTICFLFLSTLLILSTANAQSNLSLESGFKNPPVSARPKALWPWVNGNVSLPQITFELEEAKRKGMGGFDIWDIGAMVDPNHVIPAGPPFLGDESLQAIAYTIREADRIGLDIGLIFSSSWNAGGSWVKPQYGAMGLFRKDTIVVGPQIFSLSIPFPYIPEKYHDEPNLSASIKDPKTGLPQYYKEVATLAHPYGIDSAISTQQVIDLRPNVNASGRLQWEVPQGTWRIIRYVCAPTGQPLADPSPNSNGLMLDHFSAEAQRDNMKYVFDRLIPATGKLKNRSLKYLVADSYEVNSAVWTPSLPDEFAKRNHYSLILYLPVLDGFNLKENETAERFQFDFTKTLSDLIIENHYQLGRKICEENGIGFCAEAGGPGQPIHNVPFEDLKALGALSVPRGEFWNKHPQLELLQIIKGISSAAHIYNQPFVEAESFTSVWLWQEGPDELKPLADRAMCEGLNKFVYHTFPHTPPESGNPGWVYNFGTLINTTNGWWPKSESFHHYLARCSYLLQQGNFVGDIAYYYGDRAPDFVSPKHIDPSLGFGYDYDVVNTDAILNKMQVRNGKIYLPHGQSYEVLVLPNERKMNPAVLKKIQQMVAAGATVIGPKPVESYGLNNAKSNDELVRSIANTLWGKCDSVNVQQNIYGKGRVIWGKSIRDVLKEKKVLPDLQSRAESVDFIHRRTKDADIYFIRNTKKETVNELLQFRVAGKKPEIWDPETGEIIPIRYYTSSINATSVYISLPVNGSIFILFRSPSSQNNNSIDASSTTEIKYTTAGTFALSSGQLKSNTGIREVILPEPLRLNQPWVLHFDQTINGVDRDTMQQLMPLNRSQDDRIKYYSGKVVYSTRFNLTQHVLNTHRLLLDLGEVREIAEVNVNGRQIGIAWHKPFQLDITDAVKEGDNFLQVEVINTINNRLIGDARLPVEYRRMKSNITKLPNAWNTPFANAPLINAGLIGPVQIRFAELILKI